AFADAEAVAAGRFAPDPAAVEAQRAADENLDHETPLSEVFEDQIACADIVLLTKADLAGAAGIEAAKAAITAEMPRRVPMLSVTDGAIDARVILGLGAAAENDLAARPSHHDGEEDHEHDDFASVVIDLPEVSDIDALVASVQRLSREQNVLRVKGYIAVAGKPMRLLLQAVGERVRHQFDKPWGAALRQSKLVVIGEHGDIDEAAIKAGLGLSGLGI
ncbi:GTP-binding protein, partial [Bradyrhizobium japonicum]|uniref:GTP-binding protein n=1 Tax=Bradyrhizobium japonicum TaxID=375 RepID=UPI000578100A